MKPARLSGRCQKPEGGLRGFDCLVNPHFEFRLGGLRRGSTPAEILKDKSAWT